MLLQLRAALAPSTIDEQERTFECVASTGADVRRAGYIERLDLEGADLPDNAPLLDSHRRSSLADVLGVVEQWRREPGQIIAKVRLSERAGPILADIKAGILRGVSLGYQVGQWRDSRAADGTPIRTAIRWAIHELSLVPIPADASALVRATEVTMPDNHHVEPGDDLASRATHNSEIRTIGRLAGLSRDWADAQIDAGATPDQARAAAFEALAKTPVVRTASVGWSADDPQVRTAAIADAVFANHRGGTFPDGPARNYAHVRGSHDLARAAIEMAGVRTTSFSAADLIERAMSTSDFPILLTQTISRFVRAGYALPAPGVLSLARDQLVPDFRTQKAVIVHGPGRLQKKLEGAELEYSSLAEKYEQGAVVTYAVGLSLTREALINDDRSAFSTIPTRLGVAARDEEALQATALLAQNTNAGPTMVDTNPLFHTSHGNIASSPAAPDETHLSAARLAMRSQTDAYGRVIGVVPTAVLAPAALETTVRKLLSTVQAAQTTNVNTFSDLGLVIDPRLSSATRWYVVAGGTDGLVMLRLEGRAGPQVESETDFETKSIKFSILNDFQPMFVDWRGWYADGTA